VALFDRWRFPVEIMERRLERPLSGDPSRGEKGILAALNVGRVREARRLVEHSAAIGPDFVLALERHLQGESGGPESPRICAVSVPKLIWNAYARESRIGGVSIAQRLSQAIERDFERGQDVREGHRS